MTKRSQKTVNRSINANGAVALVSFAIAMATRISPTVISIPRGHRFEFVQCVETRFTLLQSTTPTRLRFGNVQGSTAITTKKVLPLRRARPAPNSSGCRHQEPLTAYTGWLPLRELYVMADPKRHFPDSSSVAEVWSASRPSTTADAASRSRALTPAVQPRLIIPAIRGMSGLYPSKSPSPPAGSPGGVEPWHVPASKTVEPLAIYVQTENGNRQIGDHRNSSWASDSPPRVEAMTTIPYVDRPQMSATRICSGFDPARKQWC